MSKKFWFIPVLILLIASMACSSGTPSAEKVGDINEGKSTQVESSEKVSTKAPPSATKKNTEAPTAAPKPSKFNVGDIVEIDGLRIVLTSSAYNNGLLKANFQIENTGKKETNVSSIMSFSAKDTEGTVLEQSYFDCGSSLDGKVLPGDRLRGDVCWKMASPVQFKIYYQAELFSNNAIVWELDANQLPQTIADVEVKPSENQGSNVKTYSVMEPIKSDDETITLTSAAYSNGKLTANFLIENTGKKEINVSSMISFYVKDSAGVKIDQTFMDCGSTLNGKVLVGDRLRGDICWELPPSSKIKMYYESELFSTGAVVWEMDTDQLPPTIDRAPIPSADNLKLQAKIHEIGETITLDGQIITLNNATLSGGILKANFTVENTGTKEITVSSMISFYARNPDGMNLEADYMSCSSSMNGTVLSGDKLKGDVCWKSGDAKEVTIYYEDVAFGVGAVVWKVK